MLARLLSPSTAHPVVRPGQQTSRGPAPGTRARLRTTPLKLAGFVPPPTSFPAYVARAATARHCRVWCVQPDHDPFVTNICLQDLDAFLQRPCGSSRSDAGHSGVRRAPRRGHRFVVRPRRRPAEQRHTARARLPVPRGADSCCWSRRRRGAVAVVALAAVLVVRTRPAGHAGRAGPAGAGAAGPRVRRLDALAATRCATGSQRAGRDVVVVPRCRATAPATSTRRPTRSATRRDAAMQPRRRAPRWTWSATPPAGSWPGCGCRTTAAGARPAGWSPWARRTTAPTLAELAGDAVAGACPVACQQLLPDSDLLRRAQRRRRDAGRPAVWSRSGPRGRPVVDPAGLGPPGRRAEPHRAGGLRRGSRVRHGGLPADPVGAGAWSAPSWVPARRRQLAPLADCARVLSS